ncbi:penicillin-binding protein 1C [Halomonas huangheensis]|uniref:peptidoglycan glycosyltransferase n=1 Tax=Halomonas huangheensis TaxID=1178482 RepID=W1NC00_9GAMM|nr:penicillin-binding protein 1C [Halomonas huangheensis]ALM52985.1 hypothetical protein AR456_12330 [Halomonas huangheensis]ERL53087.1 hypothetical protein BJB45_17580 [Halomonas huangheensis]
MPATRQSDSTIPVSRWQHWYRGRGARWLLVALLVLLTLLSAARLALDEWVDNAPDPLRQIHYSPLVLDRQQQPLSLFLSADGYWRRQVSLQDVDRHYIEMLLAYEDRRFHSHHGVDWLALVRAAMQAAWHGEIVSGGSTLSMQVVRLLKGGSTRTLSAKVAQIRGALALEQQLSKQQILELYLNLAPMGSNLEGVGAASLAWFGKNPGWLSAAEAALLVAIPQSPSQRTPDRNAQAALAARNRVLERSLSAGVLDDEIAREALQEPMPTVQQRMPRLAWHLSRQLTQPLSRQLTQPPTAGSTAPIVATSLDARWQRRLENQLSGWVARQPQPITAAMLVVDYHSGEVRARIGAPDVMDTERAGYVDMSQALRSPGSTLKPLVYALGFDDGIVHPETLINDAPYDFDGWSPSNFDGHYLGPMTVREALQASRNLPAVAVLDAVGPARLMGAMRRSGASPVVASGAAPGLAVALGGVGTRLEDMAAIYAMIANHGRAVRLTTTQQAPDPRAADADAATGPRVISERASWYLADILRQTPRAGFGASDRIAYKTGTSYGHRDAWSIGFDGRHVIAVWVGRADNGSMPGSLGAQSAAPLLFSAFDVLGVEAPDRTPPADALIASTAELPHSLRQFQGASGQSLASLRIVVPRDGAEVHLSSVDAASLFVRLQGGEPPFHWLVNNQPVSMDELRREGWINDIGGGFHRLTVLDSRGRSASASISLMP